VRVLLVEADPAMLRVFERGLRGHGFEVTSVGPAIAAASAAADESVRIAVLDMPPSAPRSRKLVDTIRAHRPGLPLLFLVASETDHADEALQKPFAMEELIARIHRLTRSAAEPRITTLVAGDLRLDLLARCAWRGDRLIDLPGREFALLEYFMRHPRRVLTRQEILADVWGYHMHQNASNSNVVDVYVRYLRNRLQAADDRSLIATVRGEGYQFNPPAEPAVAPPAAGVTQAPPPRPRGRTTKAPLRQAK
jgi:DNA-binding response OmpR family regulator